MSDGTVWNATEIGDADISALNQWLQEYVIQIARRSLTGISDQDVRSETLGVAMREALAVNVTSRDGVRILGTVDGMSQMVYQMIRRDHPDVTPEMIRAKLFSKENLYEANRVFSKLNDSKGPRRPKNSPARRKHR